MKRSSMFLVSLTVNHEFIQGVQDKMPIFSIQCVYKGTLNEKKFPL